MIARRWWVGLAAALVLAGCAPTPEPESPLPTGSNPQAGVVDEANLPRELSGVLVAGQTDSELSVNTAAEVYTMMRRSFTRDAIHKVGYFAEERFLNSLVSRFEVGKLDDLIPILTTASETVGAYELHKPTAEAVRVTGEDQAEMRIRYTLVDNTKPTDRKEQRCARVYTFVREPVPGAERVRSWRILSLDQDSCGEARYVMFP